MELKWFYSVIVIQGLSSTAQELAVTPTSSGRNNTEVSTTADASSILRNITAGTAASVARCNVTDMDVRDSIDNNETMNDSCNNTANEEEKQTNPFGLIHSGSVTEATYKSFITVTDYIQFACSVIALATNICNVIVFCQKRMKSPSSTILLALCASQLLLLVIFMIVSIINLIYGAEAGTKRIKLYYGIYINVFVAVALRRVGFCYTCLVSAERFIAVTFPLQAKSMRLVKNPGVVCALIMAVCLIAHIFSPLKFAVISYLASDNTTAYKSGYSSMYVKDKVHFENSSIASKVIFVYLMLFGCLMFNLLIVISLRRHSKGRQSIKTSQNSGEKQKIERQTTITIMASTVVFVILALPSNTSAIIANVNDDYGFYTREHFLFLVVNKAGGVCELVSMFTDFIFYIALSTAFRETFVQVFIPCAARGKPGKKIGTGSARLGTISTGISRSN
ncbi:neuromedin-U receptor 1-like [Haliotis rubra]|uniref:neuromedin-U receptor 1-like n=1 Tax=Haliotis rubra TaxID=36100 RepID=UPI001EE580C3|nr:neuromedin-U receptor 1-like [Haliotis rubra]